MKMKCRNCKKEYYNPYATKWYCSLECENKSSIELDEKVKRLKNIFWMD